MTALGGVGGLALWFGTMGAVHGATQQGVQYVIGWPAIILFLIAFVLLGALIGRAAGSRDA